MTDERRELMLASLRGNVRVRVLVIRDWWDGPIDGILILTYGPNSACCRYRLAAQLSRADDIDDRLYELTPVGEDWTSRFGLKANEAAPLVWPFTDRPDAEQLQLEVDRVVDEPTPASMMLESNDLHTVQRLWFVARHPSEAPGD